MSNISGAIETVRDTALLVAACRAIENQKPDAFVRDPFAARLAGARGIAIVGALSQPNMAEFGIAIRTRLIDELLLEVLAAEEISTVLSLGCGLDTRLWRLEVPAEVRWIEVDFAAMLDYKESLMLGEIPQCARERFVADLNDPAQRHAVYRAAGPGRALILTEGLLMYLPASTVQALAGEVAQHTAAAHWITDITTTAFSKALGGGGSSSVAHVQATDHLPCEQILETLYMHGWKTSALRSYIRPADLAFARERIERMMAASPNPAKRPEFPPDDPTGVHRLVRA